MTNPNLSHRASIIPASPIRKLAPLANAAKAKGLRVYHLNIGQPDIKSPQEFFEGLQKFSSDVIAYEQSKGNETLCQAWSSYMNKTTNLNTRPEQFQITAGGSEAIVFALMCCADPGDEIIVFDPTYANYIGFSVMGGIKLVSVAGNIDKDFHLPPVADIEAAITPKTRAVILCNPNNPTGTVYTREEIKTLLDICEEHNLFLLSDEAYREFVYDDLEPLSILNVAPNNPRVVVLDSLSKRFSLCGARLGCLISTNEEFMAKVLCFAQARLSVSTLEQFAAAYMMEHISQDFIIAVREEYQKRRDTLSDALQSIPGVFARRPQGAFYMIIRLPVNDADAFAAYMLGEVSFKGATTFVAPASGFYIDSSRGKNEVRAAYVLEQADIINAVEVLEYALQQFKSSHC